METTDRKAHWEKVYNKIDFFGTNWYQLKPETSLQFLKELNIPKSAKIIDIGGGDSVFVDHLLDLGFENITVVDISGAALEKAKKRLGEKAKKVNWIIGDAVNVDPEGKFDFWHDRAVFHFLTEDADVEKYLQNIKAHLAPEGKILIGTFSDRGPEKCSGLTVRQYSEDSMTQRFEHYFDKIKCISTDHITPMNTKQNFLFCSFKNR